ncbi:unnamed protein product, partial [Discosporangium mesarthrocarpum]
PDPCNKSLEGNGLSSPVLRMVKSFPRKVLDRGNGAPATRAVKGPQDFVPKQSPRKSASTGGRGKSAKAARTMPPQSPPATASSRKVPQRPKQRQQEQGLVDPPFRSLQLGYNSNTTDPLSYITVHQDAQGTTPQPWKALKGGLVERAAWLENWLDAALRHGVAPPELVDLAPPEWIAQRRPQGEGPTGGYGSGGDGGGG